MKPSIAFRFSLFGALIAAGCSVLNSFDDVGQIQPDGGAGTSSGSAGDGGSAGSSGSSSSGGDGGSTAGSAGSGGGGVGGSDPTGGSGGTGGTSPVEPGLVVVAGSDYDSAATVPARDQLLVALSPQTGEELARETLEEGAFVVIAHDGLRDLWYLFKNTQSKDYTLGGPVDTTFEIRRFDRANNLWETVAEPIALAAPPASANVAVLRERLAYIGYGMVDGGLAGVLVVLDTSNAAEPAEMPTSPVALEPGASGLIASFGSAIGGIANVTRTDCSAGTSCELTLQRVTIGQSTISADVIDTVKPVSASHPTSPGNAAWGSNIGEGFDVIVRHIVPGSSPFAEVIQVSPNTHTISGMARQFTSSKVRFGGVAFDPCQQIAFPIEHSPPPASVYAVPMGSSAGTVGSQTLLAAQVGTIVLFEPYTRSVLAPFETGADYGFPAYAVQGTATAPSFSRRQGNWMPPTDLLPKVAAVAQPNPPDCD